MTRAQDRTMREWYKRRVAEYVERYPDAWSEGGAFVCGIHVRQQNGNWGLGLVAQAMHCFGSQEVDHLNGRKDPHPKDLQTLCSGANSTKGSGKGEKWDTRTERFKAFMAEVAARDWTRNELMQRWEKRRGA